LSNTFLDNFILPSSLRLSLFSSTKGKSLLLLLLLLHPFLSFGRSFGLGFLRKELPLSSWVRKKKRKKGIVGVEDVREGGEEGAEAEVDVEEVEEVEEEKRDVGGIRKRRGPTLRFQHHEGVNGRTTRANKDVFGISGRVAVMVDQRRSERLIDFLF